MGRYGLLIDYKYCCGCHTCEVACQKEHGFAPERWGIHLQKEGPWKIEGTKKVQFDFLPLPTDLCDLCAERTEKGKLPTCVQHCEAACISYGPVAELVGKMEDSPKQALFVR